MRNDEGQLFHASTLWTVNTVGGVAIGFALMIALPIILSVLLLDGGNDAVIRRVFWLWGVSVVLTLVSYFPGNLGVHWPYAVKLGCGDDMVLFGPFKKLWIPISNIKYVEDSVFWQGTVVRLKRAQGALKQFVIPWYFGPERKVLLDAIRRTAQPSQVRGGG